MSRGIHSFVHIWTHLLKYLLYANTMTFAKGVSFMTSRVEMVTWKSSVLFEVPLHLTSEQQWWQAPLFDHSSCSIHQAKHLLKPAHWLHYYLYKKHQFPHSETESERGLISCPQQDRQQVKWYHNKYHDRAGDLNSDSFYSRVIYFNLYSYRFQSTKLKLRFLHLQSTAESK